MLPKQYADALSGRLSPDMFRPVPSRLLWLPVYGLVAAVSTMAIVDGRLGVPAKLGLAIMIGFAFTGMGILAHEILHGSVVERLWLRRCLGAVCLAPLGIGPAFWTIWHNVHHANTQHPAKDPDTWGSIDRVPPDRTMGILRRFTNARSLLFPFFLATGVTAHAAALLFFTQKQMTRQQRMATLAEFLVLWAFWLALGFWLGWVNFLFFFAIPLLLTNLIVNAIVVTNHFLNPLDETGDPLATSLTVTLHPWIERLLLNFNYHTEHHLFPRMSPKYAPQVARLLKETWPDRYHQMPHGRALLAVWRTPRAYHDRVQLIDTRSHKLYGTLGHGFEADELPPGPRRETPCAS
ncbi:MAG TPA: acyl-CoA desaturase [Candidatus Angelobacter sp.]